VAQLAYRVLDNFRMHLAAISPSEVSVSLNPRYVEYRDNDTLPGNSSGCSRLYMLFWLGSDDNTEATSGYNWLAWHRIQLDVFYSSQIPNDILQRAIMRDRWDINKRLLVGTSASALTGWAESPSSDFGLSHRVRESDELTREGELFVMRSVWRCQITETES